MIAKIPQGLQHKIIKSIANCSKEWSLLEEGDRIMVAFSGGKDSLLLIHFLQHIQRVAPFRFEIGVFHLNASFPEFPSKTVLDSLQSFGLAVYCENINMRQILEEKIPSKDSPCGLCSRLRRGILYTQAKKLGYNKIALGHHRDDAIETLLMNILYSGQIKSIPAKLVSDDKENIVIRPLLYTPEAQLIDAAKYLEIPVTEATFCKRGPDGSRSATKALLSSLEEVNPKVKGNLLAALQRVVPSHLLDKKLLCP